MLPQGDTSLTTGSDFDNNRSMKLGLFILSGCFLLTGCRENPEAVGLPVYKLNQTDSSHNGYRRTTLSSGSSVYVNDFEEYSLQLMNPEPKLVIGGREFGDSKVCAIEGQETTAYIAANVGSEMPAYEVFRNINQPPFNWHKATFKKMRFAIPTGPASNKETADNTLIQDVLTTLRDGKPTISASLFPTNLTNWKHFTTLQLFTDELPGMVFCVGVYMDDAGHFYLAENQSAKQWIEASALMTKWMQTR
jgi:hypothetical protein